MKENTTKIGSYGVPYDGHRFRSLVHEEFYTKLESRNMASKWTIELEDPGDYSNIV